MTSDLCDTFFVPAQGETYSFKDAIVLGEYKTDDSAVPNDKKGEKVTAIQRLFIYLFIFIHFVNPFREIQAALLR